MTEASKAVDAAPVAVRAAVPLGADVVARILAWQNVAGDAAFAAKWQQLANDAIEPNPFYESWYLLPGLQALDAGGAVALFVVEDGARLVGLMPVIGARSYGGLPLVHSGNWKHHNAFLGLPLVAKGYEARFWQALFAAQDCSSGAGLFFHINGLPTQGALSAALGAQSNRKIALVHSEERALLERGLSAKDYYEAHVRGKKRKELRRQHNRLAELGALEFERSDGAAGLDSWIDEFLALERAGWKGGEGSALDCAEGTRHLFRGALHGAAKLQRLELLTLRLDKHAIAMLVNFVTPPGSFSYKTAFDENYARFSPGVLIQIENLELLARERIDWSDSCAAQDHPMIDSLWAGRRTIGRYSVAIGGPLRRAAFRALLAVEQAKARLRRG